MRRLAVACSAAFPDLRSDWPLLRAALAELGIEAGTQVWTDPGVAWDDFDLVVANGAWDNIHRPEEFLAWADAVVRVVPLVNPPATLRWNLDKRYLAELAEAGVATVPTRWVSAGQTVGALPSGVFVVKPTVSGGGYQTARYGAGEHEAAGDHIATLLAAGRTVMIQPYLDQVDLVGEVGLIYLGGTFSHAISKGAMLRAGAGAQDHLIENMVIGAAEPTAPQLDLAQAALAAAERWLGRAAYARVDLVPLADGTPAVLELELLDPALFFEIRPEGAARFARVLSDLLP